jgi:hypothetical protein
MTYTTGGVRNANITSSQQTMKMSIASSFTNNRLAGNNYDMNTA